MLLSAAYVVRGPGIIAHCISIKCTLQGIDTLSAQEARRSGTISADGCIFDAYVAMTYLVSHLHLFANATEVGQLCKYTAGSDLVGT